MTTYLDDYPTDDGYRELAADLPHHFWYCERCDAQNSELDGECQWCDEEADELASQFEQRAHAEGLASVQADAEVAERAQ